MTNVHRIGLARDLYLRGQTGKPIRIGLIGCGEMGTDILSQVAHMQGITVAAVADTRQGRVSKASEMATGQTDRVKNCGSAASLMAAIESGHIGATGDASLVAQNPLIDVVIDATGKPGVAADFDLMAMEHGKHLVMMNVEADVTIGPYLKQEADRLGVIYSVGAGDEPSACMELIEFVSALGYTHRLRRQGQEQPAQPRCRRPTCMRRRPAAAT